MIDGVVEKCENWKCDRCQRRPGSCIRAKYPDGYSVVLCERCEETIEVDQPSLFAEMYQRHGSPSFECEACDKEKK